MSIDTPDAAVILGEVRAKLMKAMPEYAGGRNVHFLVAEIIRRADLAGCTHIRAGDAARLLYRAEELSKWKADDDVSSLVGGGGFAAVRVEWLHDIARDIETILAPKTTPAQGGI